MFYTNKHEVFISYAVELRRPSHLDVGTVRHGNGLTLVHIDNDGLPNLGDRLPLALSAIGSDEDLCHGLDILSWGIVVKNDEVLAFDLITFRLVELGVIAVRVAVTVAFTIAEAAEVDVEGFVVGAG